MNVKVSLISNSDFQPNSEVVNFITYLTFVNQIYNNLNFILCMFYENLNF